MNQLFEEYLEIIPDFSLFQESLQIPLPTHLRCNRLKIEPEVLVRRLLNEFGICLKRTCGKDSSLFVAPGLSSPGNLPEYFSGYVHPQALTSCLASVALSPRKGAYVLDMCASPGGKTSHLAQIMNNTGLIVANELHSDRHVSLGHTLSRLGVVNTVVTEYQGQQFPKKHEFDFVLADVPCSGEGMFRNVNQNALYNNCRSKTKLPELQKKILLRGFDLLKEDGVMLYATCTYNPKENESVVNHLLTNRDALLLPIHAGVDCEPGLIHWRTEKYDRQLIRTARFYPHKVDSVGFFMARIGRRS